MKSSACRIMVAVLALAMAAVVGPSLYGQSTLGTILGTVADSQGAAMPGVKVTLTNQGTNISRVLIADERGGYEFLNLLPGAYRVEAGQQGFKTFVKEGIELTARQTVRVDVPMEVGALTERVTVAATPGLIDTDKSSIAAMIPASGAQFLSPTTDSQRPWTQMRLSPLVQNTNSGTRFSLGGSYFNQAEFQVDGISAPLGSGSLAGSVLMSSEALQEVTILAANNPAEYASPGVYQQISKGGGNAFHGDGYYTYNTPALNARSATALARQSALIHYFGGNIGGPLIIPKLYDGHNRTFFSGSWQSKRERGNQFYGADVPTDAMRNGVFTQIINNPYEGRPFANNTIPLSMFDPVASKIQARYYPPTIPAGTTATSGNYQVAGGRATTQDDALDFRLDHRFSDKHWFYARVGGGQFNNRGLDSNLATMGFRNNTRRMYNSAVSYNYTARPNLLNELRAGLIRDNNPGGGNNNGLAVLRELGIQFPSTLPDARGFPVITIQGVQGLSQQATSFGISPSYQLTDTISWIKHRHTFKGGINIFWEQPNSGSIPLGVYGSFTFQRTYTGSAGNAYADFLLGFPTTTSATGINPNTYMRSANYGFFFQDDFKVRPNLTLNLGIRWDYQGAIYNKNDALFNFDRATGGLIKAAPGTPVNPAFRTSWSEIRILEATAVGLPEHTLHFADKNNFAPRIGFAWRPQNSSSFVVRGAWGKFTDILGQGLYSNMASGGFLDAGSASFPNPRPVNNIAPANALRFANSFPTASMGGAGLPGRGFDPHLINPYVQQWNLTLEKQLWDNAIRVSYLGTKSTNLVYTRDINQRVIPGNDSSRPYSTWRYTSSISYRENGGNQIYHGLQMESHRRFKNGFSYQVGYVWSKNLSDVMDQNDSDAKDMSTDAYNRALDRGRVQYNRAHNFSATGMWELPVGRGRRLLNNAPAWVDRVVSGWQFVPELFAGSGTWITPCRSANNPLTNSACGTQTARPDRIGDGNDGPRLTGVDTRKWFNIAAFVDPPATRLGTAGRNILEGPGFWHLSASLTKRIRFSEGRELWLTAAAMNLFNHPNWAGPSGTNELMVGQTAFGSTVTLMGIDRAVSRAPARAVWLRARIMF